MEHITHKDQASLTKSIKQIQKGKGQASSWRIQAIISQLDNEKVKHTMSRAMPSNTLIHMT